MGFDLGGFGNFVSNVGSAIGQGVVNSYLNKKAASKQNKYTYSLIDYENAYNNPSAVRARLEEAGYNPNLALNGVNVQSATGSAPTVQPSKLDLLQAYNLEAQYDLLKEQQKLTKASAVKSVADADKSIEQAKSESLKNKKLAKDLEFYDDTGVDPDSWQGKAFKPIWNSAQRVVNLVERNTDAENDYFWNLRMERARREYAKRFSKK